MFDSPVVCLGVSDRETGRRRESRSPRAFAPLEIRSGIQPFLARSKQGGCSRSTSLSIHPDFENKFAVVLVLAEVGKTLRRCDSTLAREARRLSNPDETRGDRNSTFFEIDRRGRSTKFPDGGVEGHAASGKATCGIDQPQTASATV